MGDSTLAQVATSMISNGDKAPTRTGEARAENKPGGSKTSPDGDETRAGVDGRGKCRQRSANDKFEACKWYRKRHHLPEDAADCGGDQMEPELRLLNLMRRELQTFSDGAQRIATGVDRALVEYQKTLCARGNTRTPWNPPRNTQLADFLQVLTDGGMQITDGGSGRRGAMSFTRCDNEQRKLNPLASAWDDNYPVDDSDGSGRMEEEEGQVHVLSAASAKRDQGTTAASEVAGHDSDGDDRFEQEVQSPEPSAASAKRDQGPTAASERAGHSSEGSDGVRIEEEGQTLVLSAASAMRDQGPTAASEAAGHDSDGGGGFEQEVQSPEPSAASAKRDQGPTAASEAVGHDREGADGIVTRGFRCKEAKRILQQQRLSLEKRLILEALVGGDASAFENASEALRDDIEVAFAALECDDALFEWVSPRLRAEKEVVLAAVISNGAMIEWASEELRSNREVTVAAVESSEYAIRYVSRDLQRDQGVLRIAMEHTPEVIESVSEDIRGDKGVMISVVEHDGSALEYVSEDLRDDYDVVLAAVQQNGLALEFASAELQDDTDAVLAAVRQNGLALQWASNDLQGDLDVVISAVSQDGGVLLWLSDELRGNAEVRRAAEGRYY